MPSSSTRSGAFAALAAYVSWGVFALYFKAVASVPAQEVLAHRIAWSAVLTVVLVAGMGKITTLIAVFADRKRLLGLTGSAVAITINWFFYIWAVGHGHALDASIGYFIMPLFSLLLGAIFLQEHLSPRQMAAVGLVVVGVGVLAVGLGHVPWVALALAVSFGSYGLLRKMVAVEAVVGLAVETLLLAPVAVIYLLSRPGGGAFLAGDPTITALLLAAGPVTTVPLVLFAYGARRLRLSTLGLMQYLNPTIQMLVAVLVLGEGFSATHGVTFALIWAGLALYSWPARRREG